MFGLRGFVSICLATAGVVNAKYIVPGARWYDTDGHYISAHGGSITIDHTGKFWLFGEYLYQNRTNVTGGVSAYSSDDLATWKYEGLTLSPVAGSHYISPQNTFQQPRVTYSEVRKEYVMWWHVDNSTRNMLLQGLATSSSIGGPYTFINATASPSTTSEDIGLFTDYKTGKSYVLYNTGPGADGGDVFLHALNEEKTEVEETALWACFYDLGTPSIVQTDESYYAILSHKTDYRHNSAVAFRSNEINGTYSQPFQIAPRGWKSYNSQAGASLRIAGTKQTTYLYLGDRWDQNTPWESRYVWLPMVIDDKKKTLDLAWNDVYDLNVKTGQWKAVQGTTYWANKGTLSGIATKREANYIESGEMVIGINGDDNTLTFTGIEGTGKPQWVAFWYENIDDSEFGDNPGGTSDRKGSEWQIKRISSVTVNDDTSNVHSLYQHDTAKGLVLSSPLLLTLKKGKNNSIKIGGLSNGFDTEGASMAKIVVYPPE
ncbi:glycoside hydrolase family 43 protein [Penicillium herquei]|nr:glycoside hydrolase family 43 protein [Penicillium herquei]